MEKLKPKTFFDILNLNIDIFVQSIYTISSNATFPLKCTAIGNSINAQIFQQRHSAIILCTVPRFGV